MASYRFPQGKVPKPTPHGNSKSAVPFYPTLPSTMKRLKDEALTHGPKETVNLVSTAYGGMMSASLAGQLPRNEHQVSNIRHSVKKTTVSCIDDELFIAMTECKSKDITAQFVRDVKAAPDPALVLATDQQLDDMQRFCTCADEFCVATVDPTFNLGDFDVTPLTYRHLLLETKRSGNCPVFLGPLLIHHRKNFATYLYFASTLVGLRREFEKLRAFGTDGEEALVDAFSHEFGFAIHLSCMIHLRRNVKEQLCQRNFPEQHRRATLDEIFGARRGTVYLEGLVDAVSSEDFDSKLASLKSAWEARELSEPSCNPGFFEWFQKFKADIFKCSAIRPVREEARLGNPPEVFTTNASESLNAVIKSKVNYQKNELNKFIDKMRCLELDQQKEVERSVCGRGKYKFRPQYRFLEVEEQKWFSMTPEARRKHMAKVNSLSVTPDSTIDEVCHHLPASSDGETPKDRDYCYGTHVSLSVELPTFADCVMTPNPVLEGIWKKAEETVGDPQKIVPAPGCSALARMVESKTAKRPHLVTPGKGGRFSCDSECPNYKSFGICSHIVAVAEVNHMLPAFIEYFKKQKKVPSLTALAKSGVPGGRGRKGGEPPRKRAKSAPVEERVPFSLLLTDAPLTNSAVKETSAASQVGTFMYLGNPGVSQTSSESRACFPSGQVYHYPTNSQAAFCMPNQFIESPPTPHLQPSSQLPLASPPPLIAFHPTVTNVNSPMVAGGDCSVMVSPSSMTTATPEQQPFKLHFVVGNISRCAGCKGRYNKPSLPPDNLCVQHEEWRQINFPNSPSPSTRFSNAYYHLSLRCIRINWPHFMPSDLVIPPSMCAALQPEHWDILRDLKLQP